MRTARFKGESARIACEISVTSSGEHELGNVQECLAAGYDEVVVLAAQRKVLAKVENLVSASLGADSTARVRFLRPEEFVTRLDELDAEAASREATVHGYKVKLSYRRLARKIHKRANEKATDTLQVC